MRVIPTRTHGIIDYAVGVVLILVPYLLGFANGGAAQYVPQVIGLAVIGLALMTDFELGMVRSIPMSTHLVIDIVAGLLLALSPWLFGFADLVYWPHLIVGLAEVGLALTTRTVPDDRTTASTLSV